MSLPLPAEVPTRLPKPKVKTLPGQAAVAYVTVGVGAPVVLVHGSLCDYRYWTPQLLALADRYQLFAPSLAHYYPPLASAAGTPFSWAAHVAQVAAFIDALAVGPVHLVGHSRGGGIAYQLAIRHPALLRSLALLDPGGPVDHPLAGRQDLAAGQGALRAHAAELIAAGDANAGLRLFVDAVSRPGFWDKSDDAFKRMARDNASTLPLQLADPMPAYDAQAAGNLVCPTLLLDGEKSPTAFRATVQTLVQWLPHAARTSIAGASHGMSLSHAGVVNAALANFWAAVPQA
ncbi:alpha/beta fold hydrolase [Chitinimonas naiadis]